MSSAMGLLAYAAWTVMLVLLLVGQRAVLVLRGRPANDFSTTGEDVSPFAERLARAHLNCVENLPVVVAVLGVAIATEHTELTDPAVAWLLAARLFQSGVHLVSTAPLAVQARFAFLLVQHGIVLWWISQLGMALYAE